MYKSQVRRRPILTLMLSCLLCSMPALSWGQDGPYGLEERVPNTSLLIDLSAGPPPQTISASGLFSDLSTLEPAPGLIPYGVNAELWSDGAYKTRYLALPGSAQIEFSPDGYWKFPANSVLVKNFYLEFTKGDPASRQIVETRFLIKNGDADEWKGLSYQWNEDASDAALLSDSATLSFFIEDADSPDGFSEQQYFFPGPEDCTLCHREAAGRVLGPQTAQLNGDYAYDGIVDNQLRTLNHIGVFSEDIGEQYDDFPRWANPRDETLSLETRARAYLATNCSHCHRPNGVDRADIDLRYEIPLSQTNTVDWAPMLGRLDAPDARVISPGNADNSTILLRLLTFSSNRMPPVASSIIDEHGTALLRAWIDQLDIATAITRETIVDLPIAPALFQSHPNPFNPTTTIEYQLHAYGPIHLAIYDVLGQKVRTLINAERAAGRHSIQWDGRDDAGLSAASGVYLYRLRAGTFQETHQLTLLR